MTIIKTLAQLKKLSAHGVEVSILLAGGAIRSSKYIYHEPPNGFYVHNYVDGTSQHLSERQMMNRNYTNIGYAMEHGALITD